MRFLRLFIIALFLLLTFHNFASAQILGSADLVDWLKGSSWTGTFVSSGMQGDIQIHFLADLSADGNLQYLHRLTGASEVSVGLGPHDKSCESAPRVLKLHSNPTSLDFTGQLEVYKCPKTLAENAIHVQGMPQIIIPVQKINLTDCGRHLQIIAKIGLASVSYELKRAELGGASDEVRGCSALKELGFNPNNFDRRSVREAGFLRKYQNAWNDFDPTVTDPFKIANPMKIVAHYTDAAPILYRDLCVPQGIESKENLLRYLSLLYAKYPRQVWGNGWKNIHLFKGSRPGEWAYYYEFSMYDSMAVKSLPSLSGTGMERVQFDSSGKLISDEVHLILNSGVPKCR